MQVRDAILIEPFTCPAETMVTDVAKKLKLTTLRHIFVTEKEAPVGVISVLDINHRVVAEGKDPSKTMARDIMSKPVDAYGLDEDLADVAKRMLAKERVMSPVVDKGKMVGILTLNQALRAQR